MFGFTNTILAANNTKLAVADSLKTIFLDTTGKSDVEKHLISSINTVSSTPADKLIADLIDKAIQFGLKLLLVGKGQYYALSHGFRHIGTSPYFSKNTYKEHR